MGSAALETIAPGRRRFAPGTWIVGHWLQRAWPGRIRQSLRAWVLSVLLLSSVGTLLAETPSVSARQHDNRKAKATTSAAARRSAIRSIPFDKLSDEAGGKAAEVVRNTTVFRRLPLQVIDCNPDLYVFLTENPDLVVDIWEVLGVSQVALSRTGQTTFDATDGSGTFGKIEYLYKSHDTHVIYCEGTYEGKLFQRPVQGKCLLVLKSAYVRETNDRYYITCRLDTFVALDHLGAEVLVKTFQPLIGNSADYNFLETTAFMASMSRTAEVNPAGVSRLASRLDGVSRDAMEQFVMLCDKIHIDAAAAQTAARASHEGHRPPRPVRR